MRALSHGSEERSFPVFRSAHVKCALVLLSRAMSLVVVTSTISLSSAPADVWSLITDTERTNRLLMGSAAAYKPIEPGAKTSARFLVETSAGGFSMSYEEAPFEWTLHKSFSVYRKMRSGPLP